MAIPCPKNFFNFFVQNLVPFYSLKEMSSSDLSAQNSGGTSSGDKLLMFGGCEGPDACYVKLVSSDGHEFVIRKVS